MIDFAKLVLDADTKGLKRAERDLESVAGKSASAARKVGQSMLKFGAGLTAGVTTPLALFGKSAFTAAMDAQEMESAFEVVFGNMAKDVRAWAEATGDAMGRSTQEIQRGALAFQELFGKALDPAKAADLSKEFAVLTQDLASFKNLSNDVAQQKLFSGLTGEAEPLRAVGVFINDAAVKAKALELGLEAVSGKYTDQQKIVARAALIQEQLADAQGDVLRTSDSAANQIKASQAAFEELQITIGTKLLPVITPLITKIGAAFEWFSNLPEPVINTTLVVAGLAAALGPLLLAIGSIITIAPTIAAAFGVIKVAALGLLANPVLLGAAAVIAGIYYAWQNWDEIKAVVSGVGSAVSDFWNEHLDPVFGWIIDGLKVILGAWLDWHLSILGYVKDVGLGVSEWLGDKLGPVWDVLKGNLAGAAKSFFQMQFSSISAIRKIVEYASGSFSGMGQNVVNSVSNMVRQIKVWLQDKLSAVFNWVGTKTQQVSDYFKDMYIAVVGNSWVPDMVEEVGQEFRKLDKLMVVPAGKAASETTIKFANMAHEVRSILGRLFPEIERFQRYQDELGSLKGSLSGDALSGAASRLRDEYLNDTYGEAKVSVMPLNELKDVNKLLGKSGDALKKLRDETKIQTVQIAKSFKDMATEALNSLDRLVGAIKGGGFFDILSGLVGFGLQLGGMGVFGKSIQKNINSAPSFAGGGFTGSGSRSGGIDGKGGFPAILHPNETVIDHTKGGGAMNVTVTMDPSTGALGAFVRDESGRVVSEAAPAIAGAGANVATVRAARMQQRMTR